MQAVLYADWMSILRAKVDMHIDHATLVCIVPYVRLVDFHTRMGESAGRGLSRILLTDKIEETNASLVGMEPLQGRWVVG